MNVINLSKDIIKFEYSKATYENNLLITNDLNVKEIKETNNLKKICFISMNIGENTDDIHVENFKITNNEKIYGTKYRMVFLTHNDHIDDITFIIAGYESTIINITRINCYLYGKFFQSTVDQHTKTDSDLLEVAAKSKYMIHRNMYNQMYNIYRVLNKVDTEYCIKNRSDEYYIDMDEYINIMKANKKLITNNLFFYGKNYYICDHLFGTNTKDFKEMILNLKDILENRKIIDQQYLSHTEKLFGVAYILNRYKMDELIRNEKNVLYNNFYVYSCNNFKDYLVTTMNVASSRKIMSTNYGKNNFIVKKSRLYIKKFTGYTDNNLNEGESDDLINNVRNLLMSINKIEDVKY
jgi:hypothetical protein